MAFSLAIGARIGRWTICAERIRRSGNYYWPCRCQCGTERAVFDGDLRRALTSDRRGSLSCGCLMRELASLRKKHGMCDHPAYHSWKFARTRCRNSNDDMYHLYGGRGIEFSERWDDFRVFWQDMGATWFEGATIDRYPDKNGNYELGNCRWATDGQQANNRRDNVSLDTDQGETTTTTLAARDAGISPQTVFARRRYGWAEEELLIPVRPHKPRNNFLIETETGCITTKQASEMTGIKQATISQRIRAGWPMKDLLSPPRPRHNRKS